LRHERAAGAILLLWARRGGSTRLCPVYHPGILRRTVAWTHALLGNLLAGRTLQSRRSLVEGSAILLQRALLALAWYGGARG